MNKSGVFGGCALLFQLVACSANSGPSSGGEAKIDPTPAIGHVKKQDSTWSYTDSNGCKVDVDVYDNDPWCGGGEYAQVWTYCGNDNSMDDYCRNGAPLMKDY
jgi:hypothetical protein